MTGRIRGYYAELFPSYPVQIYSRTHIKLASRKLYVDFPYVYWRFMGSLIEVLAKAKSPREEFEREWKRFTADEEVRRIAFFNDKPLGSISLVSTPSSSKPLLKLKVNWQVFFDYLDNKAQRLISDIEKGGSNIRKVYNEIATNYYAIAPHIIPNPTQIKFNSYALEGFKKLLRRCGEEKDIHYFLRVLLQAVEEIEERIKPKSRKRKRDTHPVELWTLQLKSDIYGIEECLKNADIITCYFYLRNLLENFIKFVVYNKIAENFKHEGYYEGLLRIFFFYEKISQERLYPCIKNFINEYGRELSSILNNRIREVGWEEKVFREISRKQLPRLSIGKETFQPEPGTKKETFQEIFGINLFNYWSACSEILHNQSPLPFFSLLEIKAFKYFLKKYVESFILGSTHIFKTSEELIKMSRIQEHFEEKTVLTARAKRVLHDLSLEKGEVIRNLIDSIISDKNLKKKIFFDPLTVSSLFYLLSPAWKHIYPGGFSKEDVEYLVEKIEPISFEKEGIKYKLNTTLEILQEKMRLELERVSRDFYELSDDEKKAVIFSFLVINLPNLIKEKIMRNPK